MKRKEIHPGRIYLHKHYGIVRAVGFPHARELFTLMVETPEGKPHQIHIGMLLCEVADKYWTGDVRPED